MKKTIIIICCAVLGVALALGSVFLFIKFGDKLFPTESQGSYTSEPIISQPTDVPPVEVIPTEYLTFTSPTNESFSKRCFCNL